MSTFSHLDETGAARMVDVSSKSEVLRRARATGRVTMSAETLQQIRAQTLGKGDVLAVARVAGIMAAKRTGEWIPLCHPLPLTAVTVEFAFAEPSAIVITARASTVGRTGVEMEVLTAVAAAALTIYDMAKALDRGMVIEAIRLEEKSGGTRGDFQRSD
jgi:cyclic pyranopterin phosphate synthase